MRYLGLAVAAIILAIAAQGSVAAQDVAAIEEYTHIDGAEGHNFEDVHRGFEYICSLSIFGTSAPSESTQREHVKAIVYLLEGYEGPDVTLDVMPREDSTVHAYVLTELIDGRSRIRRGGLLGAIEDVKPLLDARADFVRQHSDDLAAFYEAKYGWEGDLTMDARLDHIDFYWRQIGDLARLALAAALTAQQSDDPAVVADSLLEITALASAAVGYPNYLPRSRTGEQAQHAVGVDSYFASELSSLEADLLEALAASGG